MNQEIMNINPAVTISPEGLGGECISDTDCIISGCSGQVCASEPVITTCEWLAEYACYQDPGITTCRCIMGACGWSQTPELEACLLGT